MRFDIGTLDSGERSLPFGLLVYYLAVKGGKKEENKISTYLPNQNIQGRGTANKQLLRVAL